MGFALSDIKLTSPAFTDGGMIPTKHTGEGEDVSPALAWSNVPEGTRSFAIICHDPDAPLVSPNGTYGFVHWVLYNIPASTTSLSEGCTEYTAGKNDFGLAEGTGEYTAGVNDFGKTGYGGPMPPNGHGEHRYYFWILALNDDSQLEAGLTLWELLKRIEPKVIGMNRLVGVYRRD